MKKETTIGCKTTIESNSLSLSSEFISSAEELRFTIKETEDDNYRTSFQFTLAQLSDFISILSELKEEVDKTFKLNKVQNDPSAPKERKCQTCFYFTGYPVICDECNNNYHNWQPKSDKQ